MKHTKTNKAILLAVLAAAVVGYLYDCIHPRGWRLRR